MGMEMTIGIPARSVKDRSAFSGIWQRDNRLCAIKDRASPRRDLAGEWLVLSRHKPGLPRRDLAEALQVYVPDGFQQRLPGCQGMGKWDGYSWIPPG